MVDKDSGKSLAEISAEVYAQDIIAKLVVDAISEARGNASEICTFGIYLGPGEFSRVRGEFFRTGDLLDLAEEEEQRAIEEGHIIIEKLEVPSGEAVADSYYIPFGSEIRRLASFHLTKSGNRLLTFLGREFRWGVGKWLVYCESYY